MILCNTLLIPESINFLVDISTEIHFEFAGINLSENSNNIVVVVIYRSPNGDLNIFLEELEACLDYTYRHFHDSDIIIGGDFNINFLIKNSDLNKINDIFSA